MWVLISISSLRPLPAVDTRFPVHFAVQIINQFKDGVFNIMVATSVGEEGLDIGEVDLIVCYDAQKTPVRMVRI